MVVISHPTGNQFVRQLLLALEDARLLDKFHTTVYWDSDWKINKLFPSAVRAELNRRAYPLTPRSRIHTTPLREAVRLISQKLGLATIDSASVLTVADELDRVTARTVAVRHPAVAYAYEGVALQTFREAKRHGTTCIYELPSGYWYHEIELLREEAALRPDYADTIAKLKDSPAHLASKDQELLLADHIVVPSDYVKRTLAKSPAASKAIHTARYGSPVPRLLQRKNANNGKLRVIFVGSLTQRKGIAYLIDAVKLMGSNVDLTVIGYKDGSCAPLDAALQSCRWIQTAPLNQVLEEMSKNDVLVLPSISEAFGLVVTEALSCGLPVITTPNCGASEVVSDDKSGFIVPIRSAEAIAEKLDILHRDRDRLKGMSECALQSAAESSWANYRTTISEIIKAIAAQ